MQSSDKSSSVTSKSTPETHATDKDQSPKLNGDKGQSDRDLKFVKCFNCGVMCRKYFSCTKPMKAHLARFSDELRHYIGGFINGIPVKALWDTGCSTILVHGDLVPWWNCEALSSG